MYILTAVILYRSPPASIPNLNMGGGGIDSGDTISLPPCIHPEFKYGGGGGGLPPCIHPEFKYWGGGGGREREH